MKLATTQGDWTVRETRVELFSGLVVQVLQPNPRRYAVVFCLPNLDNYVLSTLADPSASVGFKAPTAHGLLSFTHCEYPGLPACAWYCWGQSNLDFLSIIECISRE